MIQGENSNILTTHI